MIEISFLMCNTGHVRPISIVGSIVSRNTTLVLTISTTTTWSMGIQVCPSTHLYLTYWKLTYIICRPRWYQNLMVLWLTTHFKTFSPFEYLMSHLASSSYIGVSSTDQWRCTLTFSSIYYPHKQTNLPSYSLGGTTRHRRHYFLSLLLLQQQCLRPTFYEKTPKYACHVEATRNLLVLVEAASLGYHIARSLTEVHTLLTNKTFYLVAIPCILFHLGLPRRPHDVAQISHPKLRHPNFPVRSLGLSG